MKRRSSSRRTLCLTISILTGFWGSPLLAGANPDLLKARALTVGCLGCHGRSGEGQGSLPPLKTLDRTTFIQKFEAYANPNHSASVMHRIAKGYSREEIRLMAELFQEDDAP